MPLLADCTHVERQQTSQVLNRSTSVFFSSSGSADDQCEWYPEPRHEFPGLKRTFLRYLIGDTMREI
jgi:hypothetical protein